MSSLYLKCNNACQHHTSFNVIIVFSKHFKFREFIYCSGQLLLGISGGFGTPLPLTCCPYSDEKNGSAKIISLLLDFVLFSFPYIVFHLFNYELNLFRYKNLFFSVYLYSLCIGLIATIFFTLIKEAI